MARIAGPSRCPSQHRRLLQFRNFGPLTAIRLPYFVECHGSVTTRSFQCRAAGLSRKRRKLHAILIMAIVPLNADQPIPPGLLHRAEKLPEGAPVIVMIHGYRYCPSQPEHDPHRHILGLDPSVPGARRLRSWPRALGFSADGTEGLGLPYGWPARGSLPSAYRRAGDAGR